MRAMRAGVTRLMRLALKEQMKQLDKGLRGFDAGGAAVARASPSADDLREDLIAAITDRAFIGEDALPRTQQEFEAQKKRARTRLPAVSEAACRLFAAIAQEYHQRVAEARRRRAARSTASPPISRAQLPRLVYKGFFSATPWEQLAHLPRYLKAHAAAARQISARIPSATTSTPPSIAELWKLYEERADKQRKAGAVDAAAGGIPLADRRAARVAVRAGTEDAVSGVGQAAGEDLECDAVGNLNNAKSIDTKDTKDTKENQTYTRIGWVPSSVDDPPYPFPHMGGVEIQQQTDPVSTEFQVGQQLRAVQRQ